MKLMTTLLLSLCIPLTVPAIKVEPYSGSRIFWDRASQVKIFDGGYSRVIRLQDGRLMAVCEHGGIDIAFSSNDGASWSDARKIVANYNNTPNCVPDLIQLADGSIVVGYNPRPSEPFTDDRHFGIRCKISTDGGETWSDEIFINDAGTTFDNGCWEPSFLQLPSGELQCYFADEGPYKSTNEQQISMCRSFDGGQTWGKAEKISFRPKHRDGMPVPVLLADGQTIAVAIEDNGWSGINDFYPTTVRCSLEQNWNDYYVDATSSDRRKALDTKYLLSPLPSGGAPYLRVMPSGETVLSWQSTYKHGNKNSMLVAVGDKNAENFKAVTAPFYTSIDKAVLWNSLSVINDTTVMAVGGIAGEGINCIKGYLRDKIRAPKSSPTIDGKRTKGEGYLTPYAQQIVLFNEKTGNIATADMAYDADSLYFIARPSDTTPLNDGTNDDGMKLSVDTKNLSDSRPQKGIYQIVFGRDGKLTVMEGDGNNWKQTSTQGIRAVTDSRSRYYVVEAAIEWKSLGFDTAPEGQTMRVNVEQTDAHDATFDTVRIPDAKPLSSYTWMDFVLQPSVSSGIASAKADNSLRLNVTPTDEGLSVSGGKTISCIAVVTPDGRTVATARPGNASATVATTARGLLIVRAVFTDGTSASGKTILR